MEFRKAPGMLQDYSITGVGLKTTVRASEVPYFYRIVMKVNDLNSLNAAVENTGHRREVATSTDGKDLPDIEGAGKLAATVTNLLGITRPNGHPLVNTSHFENSAYDETETQSRQFNTSENIVSAARNGNLLPGQFRDDETSPLI